MTVRRTHDSNSGKTIATEIPTRCWNAYFISAVGILLLSTEKDSEFLTLGHTRQRYSIPDQLEINNVKDATVSKESHHSATAFVQLSVVFLLSNGHPDYIPQKMSPDGCCREVNPTGRSHTTTGTMAEVRIWERPASVKIPTIWARYTSKKPMANGVAPIFRIQDYTEEWREEIIHNMLEFFLKDEPISSSLGVREDPEAVEEFKGIFQAFIARKMGLVAIVDNLEELGDKSFPALAGYNLTAVVTSDEKMLTAKSEKIQKILTALHVLEEKKDCFRHYNVSEFMYALGLSVHSAYRGHGLACEILKARFPLCKAVGIRVTVTVFTAKAAQRAAERAGFETLAELSYSEYRDEKGEVVFRTEGAMKLMGVRVR